MSNYFRCDVCGRETYGCNIVNSMKFCAKCYQETFGKDNQQNEIQQLKQQLEEKEKEIKKLNWQLKDKDFIIKNLSHSLSVAPNANAGQRARIDELTKIVKEKEINSLIVDYEKRISQEQELMSNMEHQLTEKQNEIDELEKELAELKEIAIVPKFKGSSIVYSIAFKEIEKVQVIAYLNRCIILCRNLKTRELHTIHCDYLFETEQEAQAKLKEMKGNG